MQRQGALYIQGICRRSRVGGLALTAGVWNGVAVLVDYGSPTLKVVENRYLEHTTGDEAGDNEDSESECSSGSSAACSDAEEVSRCWRLDFEGDSQDQRCAWQILWIDNAADCADSLDTPAWMRHNSVTWEHLLNLSTFSLHSMIAVSAEAWHAILHLITPWQYPPRLGILIYILSRLGSIRRGLAFYPRSYHAFAVSAEAISYHALRPWQYPLRLGFLSYILSRLGSIRRGLAFYSRSYYAFAVSAEAIS